MCYDISFTATIEQITDYLPDLKLETQQEIPFGTLEHVQAQAFRKFPVILFAKGFPQLKAFEWGLIADYMNTPESVRKNRNWMCNAQGEKILGDKKSYWRRIRQQRCLIPVTGIFEHRHIRGWKKTVPYFIRERGRLLFGLPGLYNYSPVPDPETGESKGTFTLITRPANELMRKIHNGGPNAGRMPLFLPQPLERQWLQPHLSDDALQAILDYEIPSETLEEWPVFSIRTRKPRPDGLSKTEPFAWPKLPPLGTEDPDEQTG